MAEAKEDERLQHRLERERKRREEAERIAERSTRELYERQRELEELAATLEQRVDERTAQLEQQLARQATLADVSGRALASMELDPLLEEVCTRTADAMAIDCCEVFELLPDEGELVLCAGVGWPEEAVGTARVSASPDSQPGYALQQREPTVVVDVDEDERFHAPGLLEEAGVRSGLMVVVPGPEDPWGIFGVHAREPRGFGREDRAFVQSMAHVLSQAITRERTREELEAYAARIERANRDLEDFVHLASHDLKEPVRMVTSYVGLLESRYGEDLEEEARELLRHAREGAERIHGMIEGLLRYARLETADKELVDADEVLDEVLASLSVQIEETGAEIDREPLPTVRADPDQLGQVLQNLVANAIKYAGGAEPPRIAVRAAAEADGWRFSVEDNGQGIPPEAIDELFEMFRQGPDESREGHGIGLAVCQRIVDRHDGDIWVDTEPGEGSTFHFTIPRSTGSAEASP